MISRPTSTVRVLIVDDDPRLRSSLARGLQASDLEVDTVEVESTEDALRVQAEDEHFDVILLDVMLPGKSGWEFLSELRSSGDETPVIFITARHELDERIKGLDLGADDYIIKPFEIGELLARMKAVFRRRLALPVLDLNGLKLDLGRRLVELEGKRVEVTHREFEFLLAIAESPGSVMTRAELLDKVWNIQFDPGTNVVDVLVARLRRKMGPQGSEYIETVVGHGYRLGSPADFRA